MKIKLYLCGGERSPSQYPLGLGYLKSNCTTNIEIVNNHNQLTDCDLIGLSSNAWGLSEAVEILQSTNIPVIIGGQGTLWKGLRKYPFKHIVIGEGEGALQTIIDGKAKNKILSGRHKKDIDTLSYPERGACGRTVPIVTARGCSFNCAFCSSQKYWGKVRFHSAGYFLDEVRYLLSQYTKMRSLRILDDLFIASRSRFNQIYEGWMSRSYHRQLSLYGFIRADLFNLEIAKKMKAMGFAYVRFGAESGSDRVLKLLNKKTTVADNQRAIDVANSVGLPVSASFMHHIPGETKSDRRATKQFIRQNRGKMKVKGWYRFVAFPGTDLYNGSNPIETDMRVR